MPKRHKEDGQEMDITGKKFPEFPYVSPDYDRILTEIEAITQKISAAANVQEQIAAMKEMDALLADWATAFSICTIRNTIDTRDPYYEEQRALGDRMEPLISEKLQLYREALVSSAFRPALEERLGSLLFKNIDISLKCFSPALIPLIQEENLLVQRYQKLCAGARIPFEGENRNLSQMGPYLQSTKRDVRRAASLAYGRFFDDHRDEIEEIFDQLVKNRDAQAKKLGMKNYVEMAFLLRGRNCYDPADVANFRRQVVEELVPVTVTIKKRQAQRLGIAYEDFQVYDSPCSYPDGNPVPQGSPDELMAAGKTMYTEMSPETADFIKLMFEHDLFDVLTKEGKSNGGYCTDLPAAHCPFIFANWNGTAGDVDVLTHEAGHAFASYMADKLIDTPDLRTPTMEGAETHSMSMEFLTAPWHHLFFKDQTAKYELFHAESALIFIPYGCQVDHFQESVYLHPEWTAAQRNEEWIRLEKLYRPYLRNDEIPFYARGAGWQRQLHIYECPFYYIDYSLAQTVSLQFWTLSMRDRGQAWEKYLAFVRQGGTKTFVDLVRSVGFLSPFEEGFLSGMIRDVSAWLEENQI